jgi:hypothetical protein
MERTVAAAAVLSVMLFSGGAVAVGCKSESQRDAVADGTAESPPTQCETSDALRGASIDMFQQAPVPSDNEVKAAAVIWGAAIAGRAGVISGDTQTLEGVANILAGVPTSYARILAQPAECVSVSPFAKASDFNCTDPCLPAPSLFTETKDKIVDAALAHAAKSAETLKAAKHVYDLFVAHRSAGKSIADTIDAIARADADSMLRAAVDSLKAAGALAEATAGSPAVAAVAGVITAWQIGFEIGTIANLTIECLRFKAERCTPSDAGVEASSDAKADDAASGGDASKVDAATADATVDANEAGLAFDLPGPTCKPTDATCGITCVDGPKAGATTYRCYTAATQQCCHFRVGSEDLAVVCPAGVGCGVKSGYTSYCWDDVKKINVSVVWGTGVYASDFCPR